MSSESETRAQRMQQRADNAAVAAAHAHTRCEEKKRQVQQLVLEIDAQQSSAVQEACNSPAAVAKRIDSVQLKSCSSPSERFAHQLDLIHGTRQVVGKLEKRIKMLQEHCGQCGECVTRCSCNCIDCWEVRAQKKQEMAQTLSLAAEAARKHCSGSQRRSVSAVKASSDTMKARAGRHRQSLQEAANLHQDFTDCDDVAAKTAPARLMRRVVRPASPCAASTKGELPAIKQSTHGYTPRSTSLGVSSNRRRIVSNEDF